MEVAGLHFLRDMFVLLSMEDNKMQVRVNKYEFINTLKNQNRHRPNPSFGFFPFLSSVAGVAWRSPGVAWHHCLETLGDLQATPSYARQQREQPKGSFGLLVAVDRKRNGNKKSVMVVVIISVCFNTRNVDTIAKKILHTVTLVTL